MCVGFTFVTLHSIGIFSSSSILLNRVTELYTNIILLILIVAIISLCPFFSLNVYWDLFSFLYVILFHSLQFQLTLVLYSIFHTLSEPHVCLWFCLIIIWWVSILSFIELHILIAFVALISFILSVINYVRICLRFPIECIFLVCFG